MRLWTLHPKYLDPKGLVALWREGLLAKQVLAGETKGYKHHPQLDRFKMTPNPLAYINRYLADVLAESLERGYKFDSSKIGRYCCLSEVEGNEVEGAIMKSKVPEQSRRQQFKGNSDFDTAQPTKKNSGFDTAQPTKKNSGFDTAQPPETLKLELIEETEEQLLFELEHLKKKLRLRNPEFYRKLLKIKNPKPHPLFKIIKQSI